MLTFNLNLKPQVPRKYWNKLVSGWWALKQLMQGKMRLRNTFGDVVKVKDEILVYEGTAEQVQNGTAKLKIKSKGHIVNSGLVALTNTFGSTASQTAAVQGFSYNAGSQWYIRCGTGSGATTATTNSLTTQYATAPNSHSVALTNPTSGTYRTTWTATWNASTLSAITITEFGLWLNINKMYNGGSLSTGLINYSTSSRFFSRLSSADGDFTSFEVNTSVPLTVQWNLTFTFA